MEPGMEVKRALCVMCSLNCGILVYVKDGKAVKIAGNPDNPVTRGFTCKRVGHGLHWLYHPDQLMYPLKRVGERGEGKWQRISYEQALDEIADKLRGLRDKYGAETLATSEGTLRYAEFWIRARFMNLFGSPNNFQPGVICGLNRDTMGAAIAGARVCTKNEPLRYTKCLVVQGSNPKGFRPRVAQELMWIRKREPGRLRLIVIDPRDTGLANEPQDMHLQIRPGTDAALMLAWLNVIINEKLYDKEFVEKHTYGFEEFSKRVQEYPPEKVAEITGLPAEKVKEAARIYATTKPAAIFGGVAPDQIGFNATRVEQATAACIAMTGNIDVPGGRPFPMFPGMIINGNKPLRDSDMELTHMLSDEQKTKHIGSERYKLMGFPGYKVWGEQYQKFYGIPAPAMHTTSAHEPTIYRGIINGDPDRIRAIITWGSNLTIRTANTKVVYDALRSPNLELSVVMDFTMTSSAQLADYVMPSASFLERCYWTTWEDFQAACCFGEVAIPPLGERQDDYYFWRGLGVRLGQEEYWPWKTHEEVMTYRASPIKYSFDDLIKVGGLAPTQEFYKYKTRGFGTATGKFELYSTALEKLGYDPLPYYKEPPESLVSRPDLAKNYPFILTTGGRSVPQYHSEFHQIATGLRERHPEPVVDINTETAKKLGISNGDWVYVETKRGKVKQKAHITGGIRSDVINCEASWWYPEMKGEEPTLHGLWESSANVLTEDDPDACDELVGGWACRALLCNVYKA